MIRSGPSFSLSQSHCGCVRWSHQDQRRPQHRTLRIQHHTAMHLPRQTDAVHGSGPARLRDYAGQSRLRRTPPVFRVLFSPADMRRCYRRMLRGMGGGDAAIAIDQKSPGTTCTYIHA